MHRQREVFRDATVIELPASGHWPPADAPEAVVGAVLPFLREQTQLHTGDRAGR
jgi:pimeloyl-ACP methyl ester carboxylesterase